MRKEQERVIRAAMRWHETHTLCIGWRKRENFIRHFKRCPYHGNTLKLIKACAALAKRKAK